MRMEEKNSRSLSIFEWIISIIGLIVRIVIGFGFFIIALDIFKEAFELSVIPENSGFCGILLGFSVLVFIIGFIFVFPMISCLLFYYLIIYKPDADDEAGNAYYAIFLFLFQHYVFYKLYKSIKYKIQERKNNV